MVRFMNAIERVAFVLRFINTKIDRLSPRATGTLRKDLIAFLDWPAAANMAQGLAEALTPSRIAEMQSDSVYIFKEIAIDLRWFLRKGVSIYRDAVQEPWQLPGGLMVSASVDEKTREPNGHTIHIWLGEDHLLFNILQPGQAHVQCVSPDLQTSFRVTLAAALMSAGVPAVRLCPVCDRVFVGSGKRQFCTLRCKSIE